MLNNGDIILSVKDLHVKFSLRGKVLNAIRGISLDLYKGESLAIVGESGSGKSVFTKNFIGLLDKNGWVDSGEIWYYGMDDQNPVDLAKYKTEEDWQKIRGKEVAMVMQDPMTSLNPLKTIGWQIEEALKLHQGLRGEAAAKKAVEILSDVGIPEPDSPTMASDSPLYRSREMPRMAFRTLPRRLNLTCRSLTDRMMSPLFNMS